MGQNYLNKINELCNKYQGVKESQALTKPIPKTDLDEIVSISDLHIPFVRMDLIETIINRTSGARYLVINGDLLEGQLLSNFPKEKHIPFLDEYKAGLYLLKEFSKRYEKVIVIDGNHDTKRYKRLLENMPSTLNFLFPKSPLQLMVAGYDYDYNFEIIEQTYFPNVIYAGDVGDGWWYKIGNVIFAHRQSGFKRGPLANTEAMAQWFVDEGIEFQALVTGHSHQVGKTIWKNKLLIDQGCLCTSSAYHRDGSCKGLPTVAGYAIVRQDSQNNVDFDRSDYFAFGTYQGDLTR